MEETVKKKIVLIGPVYPYKGGIAHYTSLLYRALAKKYNVEMISYKMQYPKLLFKNEQKDFSNDISEKIVDYFVQNKETEFVRNVREEANWFDWDRMVNRWRRLLQWL